MFMDFCISEKNGVQLMLLANEYKIHPLKMDCEKVLMKVEIPRLDIVFAAHECGLENLLEKSTRLCCDRLPITKKSTHGSIDTQLQELQGCKISKDALLEIYRYVKYILINLTLPSLVYCKS